MTALEYVTNNIGKTVFLTGDGDLGQTSELRPFIGSVGVSPIPLPLTFIQLTKGGMAIVEGNGVQYQVPPKNIQLYSDLNAEFKGSGFKRIQIFKSPISERYWYPSIIGKWDINAGQIRVGGAWFPYEVGDDRWEFEGV